MIEGSVIFFSATPTIISFSYATFGWGISGACLISKFQYSSYFSKTYSYCLFICGPYGSGLTAFGLLMSFVDELAFIYVVSDWVTAAGDS